jgi:hypothetical protein
MKHFAEQWLNNGGWFRIHNTNWFSKSKNINDSWLWESTNNAIRLLMLAEGKKHYSG